MTDSTQDQSYMPSLAVTINRLSALTANHQQSVLFRTKAELTQTTIYYPSAELNSLEKRALCAALSLCGRATDPRPNCWQTWVCSWAVLCFPELLKDFKAVSGAGDYRYEVYPETFIQSAVRMFQAQASEERVGTVTTFYPPHLPNAEGINLQPESAEAWTIVETMYAYYAMIVYIMGKSLSPESIVAITTRRPNALISKRQLFQSAYVLTGEGQILPDNYRLIQAGWIRSTPQRIAAVKHHARLAAATNRPGELDSIAVTMDMLRNANQSYIYYINRLLITYPWVLEIPALRSSFMSYSKMVDVIAAQDEHLQPYYKLMHQDGARDVSRRPINNLIALATYVESLTNRQMSQYRVDESSLVCITAFKELAIGKGIRLEDIQNPHVTDNATI